MSMYDFTFDEIKALIQLNHPEKFLAIFPGMSEDTAARIYGLKTGAYKDVKNEFKENAVAAAEELLSDDKFVEDVRRMPFLKGQKIVGYGDSITDDYQSWFEILSVILDRVHGKNNIKTVNAAISGDTSLNLIKRFPGVAAEKPDWIICMIGTNDSIRSMLFPSRTNITFEETAKNFDYLVELGKQKTEAEWIWITPSNVNTEKIASGRFTEILQNCWKKEDLQLIGKEMKKRSETAVDTWELFGNPLNDDFLLEDGLHPSIEGHKLIVRKLVHDLVKKYGENVE